MRLAISNIAWDIHEDRDVAKILQRFNVDAIDIAPGKYFPEPANVKEQDIVQVKQWWADQGIEITGMQALLFGTTGLNLFGDHTSRTAMLDHLNAVSRIGAGLGATRLVFGSPKNRDRSGLSDEETLEQAVSFFRQLGDSARSFGVNFCLEPNPTRYGANFMTDSRETAQVVEAVNHSAIRMQFDTGSLTINRESPNFILSSYSKLIGHVHASEPDLLPLGDGGTDHSAMYTALHQHLPDHLVSIEMLATKDEPHLQSIERAINCAVKGYRSLAGASK